MIADDEKREKGVGEDEAVYLRGGFGDGQQEGTSLHVDDQGGNEGERGYDDDAPMPILFQEGLPSNFATNNDLAAIAALIAEGENDDKKKTTTKKRGKGKVTRAKKYKETGKKTPYERKVVKKNEDEDEEKEGETEHKTTTTDVAEATLFLDMWKP